MTAYMVRSRKSLLGLAALLAWGFFVFVSTVRADDPPEPSTTVDEQKRLPPDESRLQTGHPARPDPGSAPLRLVGPMDNLTAIANALSLKHKGLTEAVPYGAMKNLAQRIQHPS